jgi:hypothetical protein
MRAFSEGALGIGVVENRGAIELHWRGRGLGHHPGRTLGYFLAQAVDAAAERRATLELRFEALQEATAATIATIIQCLQTARARAVPVRIVYDAELEWQQQCFEPMSVVAPDSLLELCSVRSFATRAGV